MSKVVIDDSKLVNIADAIRNKNGSANKYTPTEMATAIGEIKASSGMELAPEDLVLSGDCAYKFYNNNWYWFIEKFGDKITTKDITNCNYMFYQYNKKLSTIPFSLNFKENTAVDIDNIFQNATITSLPPMNNLKISRAYQAFYGCSYITEIPEDYFDKWDFSYIHESDYSGDYFSYMFAYCYRLRKIPSDLSMFYDKRDFYPSVFFYQAFMNCCVLEKITNLPVTSATLTNNSFRETFSSCSRLKQITFSLNDGMPKTASWQAQVIDLNGYIGHSSQYNSLTNYGMTSDTKITDDASYQLLKDNEDSWTQNIAYSRYNHDSAVETINTLPDTSAYLAESGGTTNIIKFTGASGSATDGGAINTLTEEEIAVAAAKGWSVALV